MIYNIETYDPALAYSVNNYSVMLDLETTL